MHLFANTCKTLFRIVLAVTMFHGTTLLAASNAMQFKWHFQSDNTLKYIVDQKAQIQRFKTDPDQEHPVKSPVHEEFTGGYATLKTLVDGNAYGELILQLTDIRENSQSIEIPEKQKIPQKVCRFVMTPEGDMEQYSGPKKETYILVRLLFGLPVKKLKLNEVQVYPFKVYTGKDEARSPIVGQISHEFKAIEQLHGKPCAQIKTTIDLSDQSPGDNIRSILWKGTGISLFNIDDNQLEKSSWQLALKKEIIPPDNQSPNLIVEIFELNIKNETWKGISK